MFDISVFADEQIETADQLMIKLLEMRILPDPLQDDVYLFSLELEQVARERREKAQQQEAI